MGAVLAAGAVIVGGLVAEVPASAVTATPHTDIALQVIENSPPPLGTAKTAPKFAPHVATGVAATQSALVLPTPPATLLDECGTCDFAFRSSVGGTADSASAALPTSYLLSLHESGSPDVVQFGQLFTPTRSGTLTSFQMSMSCLAPTSAGIHDIAAVIFQTDAAGANIVGDPLAMQVVNLSACPTVVSSDPSTWNPTSFAYVSIPISGINVTAGDHYAMGFVHYDGPTIISTSVTNWGFYRTPPAQRCTAIDGAGNPARCVLFGQLISRSGDINLFRYTATATDSHGVTVTQRGYYRVSAFFISGVRPDSRGIYHLKYGMGYTVVAQVGDQWIAWPRYYYAVPAGPNWWRRPYQPGPYMKYYANSMWIQSIHIAPTGMNNGQLWNIGVLTGDGVLHVLHIVAG